MRPILHITNGSSLIDPIRAAGLDGAILCWNDVLHEGPVPDGLGPAALRERRAAFLAGCGWGRADAILRELTTRDEALDDALTRGAPSPRRPASVPIIDEIVLWLEFDLYDQLQRLQILDRVPLDSPVRLTAVPDGEYLGRLPADRFRPLFAARREVTSAERLAARDGWTAFRSADPRQLVDVLPRAGDLRHLAAALRRHLQQFPSMEHGLSRTEHQALDALRDGPLGVRALYDTSHQQREEAIFMGDAAFLAHIAALAREPRPLLRPTAPGVVLTLDSVLELTDDGRRVLDGAADRVALGGIERWLGGVHLSGRGPVWRWDAERGTVRMA